MLCCGRTAPKPQKHYDDKVEDLIASGAIAGIGIESGSFRYGWFHQAMVECDLLTPGGEILRCSASNEHADVFHALPNSYGTLGYVLRATLRLVVSKPYVSV